MNWLEMADKSLPKRKKVIKYTESYKPCTEKKMYTSRIYADCELLFFGIGRQPVSASA